MTGKQKCKALKEIRAKIAEENDIAYAVEECSHKGNCKGTCPRCEAELRYLERELEKRKSFDRKVAVAGIATGVVMSLSACTPMTPINAAIDFFGGNTQQELGGVAMPDPEPLEGEAMPVEPLEGDVEYIPDDSEIIEDGSEIENDSECPSDIEVLEGDVAVIEGGAPYVPEDEEEEEYDNIQIAGMFPVDDIEVDPDGVKTPENK